MDPWNGPNYTFLQCLDNLMWSVQAGNAVTQVLLRAVNMSGKLHMVPAIINDDYVIRFAVCSVLASDADIAYAWSVICETTSRLASQSASFDVNSPDIHVCPTHRHRGQTRADPARLGDFSGDFGA